MDLGAAPRRAFLVTWQLVMVGMVGVPLVALSEPFLPGHLASVLFLAALVLAGIAFWRGATNLQRHTRAGAEVIVAALAKQRASWGVEEEPEAPIMHRRRASDAAGVQALVEVPEPTILPVGAEVLQPGDLLALAGTPEAVSKANTLLRTGRLDESAATD